MRLYKERKISNLTTAENMIIKLITIQPSDKNKTMEQYEKLINKYQHIEPLNVRTNATKTKNIEKESSCQENQRSEQDTKVV